MRIAPLSPRRHPTHPIRPAGAAARFRAPEPRSGGGPLTAGWA